MADELQLRDDAPAYPQLPDLTPLQSAFVHEVLADPRCKTRAAVRAGYARKSAHVTSSRLMRHPIVAQAILDGTRVMLAGHAAEALGVQVALMRTAKSELVRSKAADSVLDRAGLTAEGRGQGGVSVNISFDLG